MKNIKDVNTAFDILIEQIQLSIKDLKELMNSLIDKEDFKQSDKIYNQIKEVDEFLIHIKEAKQNWNKIFAANTNSKKINRHTRAKKGQKTPEKEFIIPILKSIVELGGKAKVKDVLEKVLQKMKDKFTEVDFEPLPSDNSSIRWVNTAQWCRMNMVNEGLLSKKSPRGIWEITEKGKEYLKQNSKL